MGTSNTAISILLSLMAHLTTSIASINISALTSDTKLDMLRQFITRCQFDIVLLQEVAVTSFNFYGYKEVTNIGQTRRGTAILFKETIPLTSFRRTPCGRAVSCKFGPVTLINIYAPSGSDKRKERNDFYRLVLPEVFQLAVDNIVLAGDFNCVQKATDCSGEFHPCAALNALVTGLHLRDTADVLGHAAIHTYRSGTASSRLDRVYASDTLAPQVKAFREYAPAFAADHLAVSAHINLGVEYAPRGPSYWKLNTQILRDPDFLPAFKRHWKQWLPHRRRFTDQADWWDNYVKPNIGRFCRRFTSDMYKIQNELVDFYQTALDEAVRQPISPVNRQITSHLKATITTLHRRRLQVVVARSGCDSPCGEEQATMYHVVRRHKRARSRVITSLETQDGTVITVNSGILTAAKEHLEQRYAAPIGPSIAPKYLDDTPAVITQQEATELAEPITLAEVQTSIEAGAKGKCPGPDGLPLEFYRATWSVIKEEITEIFNTILARRKICASHKAGVVVLVPKVAQPKTVQQFRPLTMLNCDYKILARILNTRIIPLMPRLLHPSQVGPGSPKDITASLCDVREAIAYHDANNIPASLVSLDLQWAFDLVDHSFLFAVIERLGFGQVFTSWLRCLYANTHSRVEINGFISTPFPIGRSVRQGGPESMTLFMLAIRPLAANLARALSPTIVRHIPFVLANYVDDTEILLTRRDQIPLMQRELAAFSGASGLVVNFSKTKALPIGGWQEDKNDPFAYVQKTKILGIFFSPRVQELPALNWPAATSAANAVLQQSTHRQFCTEQRVRFVNTYAMSKLWYLAKVVPPDTGPLTAVRKHVSSLVWEGWRYRVPYPVLCLPLGQGGFGLQDAYLRCVALYYSRWLTLHDDTPDAFATAALLYLHELYPLGPGQVLPTTPVSVSHFRFFLSTHARRPHVLILKGPALTARVYEDLRQQSLPSSIRVEGVLPNTEWQLVWQNVGSRRLSMHARSTWFSIVHNLYPTRDKLHRHGSAPTDRCASCGRLDTILHRLTTCGQAAPVWTWLKEKISSTANITQVPQDFIIRPDLDIPDPKIRNTVVWTTGNTLALLLEPGSAPSLQYIRGEIERRRQNTYSLGENYLKRHFGPHLHNLLV